MHTPSAPLSHPPTAPEQIGGAGRSRLAGRIITVALIIAALFALWFGIWLRKAVWFGTDGAHFQGDVRSAWRWGNAAACYGLFNFYELNQADKLPGIDRLNDYTPLRLALVTAWTRWTYRHFPGVTEWRDDYDFTWPMLTTNTIAEALSSVLVFLLIWVWVRRSVSEPTTFTGVTKASIGALLFWFNPAVLWDGHCWPQWDVWLVPFFLGAVLLASVDWWLMAGVSLVVGAFLKGQLLLGAPVLLAWPILGGRPGAALKLVAGFAVGGALLALPWMKPSTGAIVWCAGMSLAIALGWGVLKWYQLGFTLLPALCALLVAGVIFATIPFFDASTAWFTVGFRHGTAKFSTMMAGNGVYNVPKMLMTYFRLQRDPGQIVTLPWTQSQVPFNAVMRAIYGACVVLCGIGAAMHAQRRDPRFLAAIVTPWLCFAMLLTQMHGRYTVWAAGISALLAGVGFGAALLGIIISLISLMGIVQNQYLFVPEYDPETLRMIQTFDPHIGWVLLTVTGVLLYLSIAPRTSAGAALPARLLTS